MLLLYSQGTVFRGKGYCNIAFLYIPIHSMPGPLSHSHCVPVWLLPVSSKDGKLQEGSEGACSVLWTVVEQLLSSLKQTIAADAKAGVRLFYSEIQPHQKH